MIPCDREGVFRASVVDYGVEEAESGAIAVVLQVKLLEWFGSLDGSPPEWHRWEQYDMEAEGRLWIIKKDGTINQSQAEALMAHAGWDGSFASIANATWNPTKFAVTIGTDEHKGKIRYRINWINDYNRTPGAVANITPDKAKALEAKYGSVLRALRGNIKRATTPANGSAPLSPPPPKAATKVAPPPGDDPNEIPF